ncbi:MULTISPECIES: biopolymer transporter ExbD [unclassified Methylophilus]|jgi:biopolymer transport protein ExbD|uniref:ExbD/TolR family protein n=1 Tax=unclassified Methylophilus TaxID=2630143 RepID=UPI0006FC63CE|nr:MULTISPECIES: biopolymer transporter ExbD [unclassified Methylophilus]KQT37995.1 biopolymer transporter ExbD [Methylophilus sp. Leaf414]KQT43739.1 biopolymer transporter ExbD [Methylophilus sp. Leaf416]KQT59225.1 biopolymer transporter ExbD [Methylophilus sp. Leaf459]
MNFKRGVRDEELEINFIPLIDVLLVIIIFLIVSATFSRTSELQINLPTADASSPQEKPLTITVEVDASGRYLVNGKEANGAVVADLSNALTQAAASGPAGKEPTIIINADAKATHQSVINIMEASRMANYTHITFATQVNSH